MLLFVESCVILEDFDNFVVLMLKVMNVVFLERVVMDGIDLMLGDIVVFVLDWYVCFFFIVFIVFCWKFFFWKVVNKFC